jgi:hypothetical protein
MALLFRELLSAESSLTRNVELNPERPRTVCRGFGATLLFRRLSPNLSSSASELLVALPDNPIKVCIACRSSRLLGCWRWVWL